MRRGTEGSSSGSPSTPSPRRGVAIVLAGLPKAGKTVVAHQLYHLMRQRRGLSYFREPLNPDCEGLWVLETPSGGDRARELKQLLKARGEFFSPQFVERKLSGIGPLLKAFEVVVFELGGLPSPENARFLAKIKEEAGKTHVVLLAPEGADSTAWERFLRQQGFTPLLVRTSFPAGDFRERGRQYAEEILRRLSL